MQLLETVKDKPCSVVSIDKIFPKLRTREHIIDRELEKVRAACKCMSLALAPTVLCGWQGRSNIIEKHREG